jgi:CheY-like chemotaxis protein
MMIVSDIRSATNFKQTVLIIDDQLTALDIHKAILKSLRPNLNIVTMTSPVEALKWAKHKQVDLVITDFSMAQMNGMEFVQTINQTNHVGLLPIIVITVLKDKALHKALHKALIASGATACLTKPVAASSLKKVADFLLNQSKQFYNDQKIAIN